MMKKRDTKSVGKKKAPSSKAKPAPKPAPPSQVSSVHANAMCKKKRKPFTKNPYPKKGNGGQHGGVPKRSIVAFKDSSNENNDRMMESKAYSMS
jgi:hypothetical protein